MVVKIDYFPNQWTDLLHRAISEDENNCKVISLIPKPNSQFSDLVIELPELGKLIFLGMWMGNLEMKDAMDKAMPKMEENVKNLVEKITTQSEN